MYDDFYNINQENGKWIEYLAEDYGEYGVFDFSVFNDYTRQDFKKVDNYYIPKGDLNIFYCDFFRIGEKDAYTDCEVKFYFEKGKVTKIVADCLYGGELDMTWTYEFTYDIQDIQIPEADVRDKDIAG